MILAALILAQSFFVQKLDGPGENYIVYPESMPTVNIPYVPAIEASTDLQILGNPGFRSQRYEYPNEQNGYPQRQIRSRNDMLTVEQRLAMEQQGVQQATEQARLAATQFNLQNARANAEYDTSINAQANQGLQQLRNLNPQSADFPTQLANLQSQYPLAFQNPGFNQSVNRLQQTYSQTEAARDIAQRQQDNDVREEAKYTQRLHQDLRSKVAGYGEAYLQDYDRVLQEAQANDMPVDPVVAYSTVAQRAQREQAEFKAQQERQQRENQPLTNNDYLANIRTISAINKDVADGKITSQEAAPQLEALNQQVRTYETQRGITRPATAPIVQQYREGQTATNPQTGKKMVYRNGNWVNQ